MARGSRIINVRFSESELTPMLDELSRYNSNPTNRQMTLSDFVRQAVVDKIKHATRSRTKRRTASSEENSSTPQSPSVNDRLSSLAKSLGM